MFTKKTKPFSYSRMFGYRPLPPGGSSANGCCAFQTTNPAGDNYIAPCCVEDWSRSKPAPSAQQSVFHRTSLFRTSPSNPS